jgi:hypothetical protein
MTTTIIVNLQSIASSFNKNVKKKKINKSLRIEKKILFFSIFYVESSYNVSLPFNDNYAVVQN